MNNYYYCYVYMRSHAHTHTRTHTHTYQRGCCSPLSMNDTCTWQNARDSLCDIKTKLGAAQKARLFEWLSHSLGVFKIISSPVAWTGIAVKPVNDGWAGVCLCVCVCVYVCVCVCVACGYLH